MIIKSTKHLNQQTNEGNLLPFSNITDEYLRHQHHTGNRKRNINSDYSIYLINLYIVNLLKTNFSKPSKCMKPII